MTWEIITLFAVLGVLFALAIWFVRRNREVCDTEKEYKLSALREEYNERLNKTGKK